MLTLYYLMKKTKVIPKLTSFDYYQKLYDNKTTKVTEDKDSVCRVCLQKGSILIFGNHETENVLEALRNIGQIHINEFDDYPKYLCGICHDFLKSVMLFKLVAKQSDKVLKRIVKEETILDQSHDNDFSDTDTVCKAKDMEMWEKDLNSEIKKEIQPQIKYTQKVTCNICNKVVNRSYYKEHMTMHDPDHKKFVCDVCGKSFRLRCAYHNHSLRHRTDFPYKCQFCPYRGRYSELLKTHMRTHTGDYRYMCTECPARFLFKSNLNSHMLKHKEPQYKCEACKRAFHTKLMLQRHFEADHLGIKNHVCNMCGKAFGYRNALMKHQRHVHKREKLLFGRMPAYLVAEHRNDNG